MGSTSENISANRPRNGHQFAPLRAVATLYSDGMVPLLRLLITCLLLGSGAVARAQVDAGQLQQQVREFALSGVRQRAAPRVEIVVGELDGRLRLAPCAQAEPYLLNNAPLWGRTRIGVRCVQGTARWNVFLPLTVKVFGTALVAARPLPAGSVIVAADLARSGGRSGRRPGPRPSHGKPLPSAGRWCARSKLARACGSRT